MTKTSTHISSKAPEPVGFYPHARRVGDFLFMSGIGPRKRGTKEIPGVTLDENRNIVSYDFEAQCHSVFENVRNILEDSGAQWEDLVDVTVYLTNMRNDFVTYNKLWAQYFKENPPCRTTVEVTALPTPIAIELKCVAALKD
jgi:2-aminomuconate deaminase